jgi:putative DNA primase/helicase
MIILGILSPEPRCGKTTLASVLKHLVHRGQYSANISPSSFFRVVQRHRPTLLIDEVDTFLPENEELRGVLNSGHRCDGEISRCVGDDHEPRQFSTYAACAIALIGKLPDTLADRAISIELRRRLPNEPIRSLRIRHAGHLDLIARRIARWVADNVGRLNADPEMPAAVFKPRRRQLVSLGRYRRRGRR